MAKLNGSNGHLENAEEETTVVSDTKLNYVRSEHMKKFGGPTVWVEFTPVAQLTSSVNLGQGAPGWGAPELVKKHLTTAVNNDGCSQYAPPTGNPLLVKAIRDEYIPRLIPTSSPKLNGTHMNGNGMTHSKHGSDLEVLVTNGASQAISLACQTYLNAGDEVVVIEPTFDLYIGLIHARQAKPVYIPLLVDDDVFQKHDEVCSSSLTLDYDKLRNSLSEKTRMMIINSPHNPTGKVFSREELERIAEILEECAPQCIVISDEVYEHIVFDGQQNVSFASVNEFTHSRTVSVFSCGKTFHSTGLKVGFCVGAAQLIRDLRILQQYMVFAVNHASQVAMAGVLNEARSEQYYDKLRAMYEGKRDRLMNILKEAGFKCIRPQGTFFICAHIPEGHRLRSRNEMPSSIRQLVDDGLVEIDEGTLELEDYNVCRAMVAECGVVGIPLSVFFCEEDVGKNALSRCVVRFGFCQEDVVLEDAGNRLQSAE